MRAAGSALEASKKFMKLSQRIKILWILILQPCSRGVQKCRWASKLGCIRFISERRRGWWCACWTEGISAVGRRWVRSVSLWLEIGSYPTSGTSPLPRARLVHVLNAAGTWVPVRRFRPLATRRPLQCRELAAAPCRNFTFVELFRTVWRWTRNSTEFSVNFQIRICMLLKIEKNSPPPI